MNNLSPREVLDAILGYLGFAFEIEEQERGGHLVLQVFTHDSELLIGKKGQVLDDLQYLVNKLLQAKNKNFPRVIVDVEHYRQIRDDSLLAAMDKLADAVRATGRSIQTEPLNSYDRFLVHNHFKDDPQVATWSPPDDARLKRITLKKRRTSDPAG